MANRQRTCRQCGAQFEYEIARGNDRWLCSVQCQTSASLRRAKALKENRPQCSVDGCDVPTKSAGMAYCETHYYRVRRNGSLSLMAELSPPPKEVAHVSGYVLEYAPDHYEAQRTGNNRVYQHRRVFYDNHGSGPFDCHWCGAGVTWETMHVDHVNTVRDDNSPSNLVASCPACNNKRGQPKAKAAARTRSPQQVTWQGRTRCLADWADDIGIDRVSLKWRIDAGWPIDRAMTEPRGKSGPRAASL